MSYLVLGLSFILVILISGCLQQESYQFGQINDRNNKSNVADKEQHELVSPEKDITQTKGLGNLCDSLSGCFVFCKNNVGRCTGYCRKNPTHNLCKPLPPAETQQWTPDVVTQPLPKGASKIRLTLPVPIDKIDLTKIGGYGAHHYGHREGLDHEWIYVKDNIPIGSWADGEVVYARINNENDPKSDYRVVIYYGDGLWGEHMHVRQPLVKEGDFVKAGDPVAYGQKSGPYPEYQFAEFNVADQHRQDGVIYWYKFVKGATLVSPFDYLEEDVKQQLVQKWEKEVIGPYLTKGEELVGSVIPTPWEPYLTNPMLLHRNNKDTLIGEWFLRSSSWGNDGIPDMIIFLPSNTKYHNKSRVIATEDEGEVILPGDWEADYQNNRIVINTRGGIYYGIFELDESQPQAKLKIEYRQESYPTSFSEKAHVYTERETISKAEEIHYWQYPEDNPKNW